MELVKKFEVRGIANITGGGFYDNLPRILPQGLGALIDSKSWPRPLLFETAGRRGNISHTEMYRTFNMGIGMVLVMRPSEISAARKKLKRLQILSWEIGEIISGGGIKVR